MGSQSDRENCGESFGIRRFAFVFRVQKARIRPKLRGHLCALPRALGSALDGVRVGGLVGGREIVRSLTRSARTSPESTGCGVMQVVVAIGVVEPAKPIVVEAIAPTGDLFDVTSALKNVEHVDGVFLGPATQSAITVFVLAKEHGLVDRSKLLDLEEELSASRGLTVILTVRAHQGRDLRTLTGAADLLFDRG